MLRSTFIRGTSQRVEDTLKQRGSFAGLGSQDQCSGLSERLNSGQGKSIKKRATDGGCNIFIQTLKSLADS